MLDNNGDIVLRVGDSSPQYGPLKLLCQFLPCNAMPCHDIPYHARKKATPLYHTLPPPAMQPSHHPLITCWTFLLRWMSLKWYSSLKKKGFPMFFNVDEDNTKHCQWWWHQKTITSCPGRRASLSPALSVFSLPISIFTLLHAVTPSCGRELDRGDLIQGFWIEDSNLQKKNTENQYTIDALA